MRRGFDQLDDLYASRAAFVVPIGISCGQDRARLPLAWRSYAK